MKKIFAFFLLLATPLMAIEPPLSSVEVVEEVQPVVVLGGGVGALTSAIYLARAGIPPLVITGDVIGGTITQSHNVQNWPGMLGIPGWELGEKVREQAEQNGATLREEVVVSVDFSKRPFLITTRKSLGTDNALRQYKANSCIIALGAQPNMLHILGEKEYWSRGVHTCAVCDGSFYKDKEVAIAGGGDGALIEAQYLSNIASKVHLLVRRDEFRSVEKERMREILAHPKIEVHYNTIVQAVKGDDAKVTHLLIQDTLTHTSSALRVDALFLAIGSKPNTDLFRGQLELDAQGYIVLKKHQETAVEGVYAVGDVSDPEFKQAISAAGDAAKAALQAQKHLAAQAAKRPQAQILALPNGKVNKVIEIATREELRKQIAQAEGILFIDFYSPYCGPCRMFAPLYDEWAKDYGEKITFLKVNAEVAGSIFREYGVQGIPTLIILDDRGNVLRRSVGLVEISEVGKRLAVMKERNAFSPQDLR